MILARLSALGTRTDIALRDAVEVSYDPAAPPERAYTAGRLLEPGRRFEADERTLRAWLSLNGISDDWIDRAIASLARGHLGYDT
ncbi:hypothetical protein [Streptomonospora litoralis]|uniref:Uncharacterized protein n=1 Tax=Streptomonospora litoralis TaxID=2498135 RepID=A0A4P6Q725_9ACTN|nr:hypothetical protein [Streptomonospora litoralis]QBI56586.1 hypothetical protein EKD16_24205 [Streptomonospora litoralis]